MKDGRICYPKTCHLGTEIILSYRHLKNSKCMKDTLAPCFLLESRRQNSCINNPLSIPGVKITIIRNEEPKQGETGEP
jgi:hypothetical protein